MAEEKEDKDVELLADDIITIKAALVDISKAIAALETLSPDAEEIGEVDDGKNRLEDARGLLQDAIGEEGEG